MFLFILTLLKLHQLNKNSFSLDVDYAPYSTVKYSLSTTSSQSRRKITITTKIHT